VDIRAAFMKLYWKMERLITPGLRSSQHAYEETLRDHLAPDARWLDLGCGHQLLPDWRETQEQELVSRARVLVGVDYCLESLKRHRSIRLKARADIGCLPFGHGIFDLVTANTVVEHLDDPKVQFGEALRVLKPGGLFIFHTPNGLGYPTILARLIPEALKARLACILERRQEHDVFRTYYRANTRGRIRRLAEQLGFDVLSLQMVVSSAHLVVIPPLVIAELCWIRLLMTRPLEALRTNIIAILRKSPTGPSSPPGGDPW